MTASCPGARAAYSSEVEVKFIEDTAASPRVEVEHRKFERMGVAAGEKVRKDVDGGWPALLELFGREALSQASGEGTGEARG